MFTLFPGYTAAQLAALTREAWFKLTPAATRKAATVLA